MRNLCEDGLHCYKIKKITGVLVAPLRVIEFSLLRIIENLFYDNGGSLHIGGTVITRAIVFQVTHARAHEFTALSRVYHTVVVLRPRINTRPSNKAARIITIIATSPRNARSGEKAPY